MMKHQAAPIGTVVIAAILLCVLVTQTLAQQTLQVRIDRWLQVRQVMNQVTIEHNSNRHAAQVGDRLRAIGDSITTGKKSAATLVVDTGVGFIE